MAARLGSYKLTQLLLEKGVDLHAEGETGQTALHAASWNGHATIVSMLLEK
jgi:ankyrin repeat protein